MTATTGQQNLQEKEEKNQGIQEPQNDNNNNYAPDFETWIQEKPRHNYIRLEVNVPKVVRFKSGKPDEMLMSNFGGKLKEPKPVARYLVSTLDEPKEQKALDITSKRLAGDIQAYFVKGFAELEITRIDGNPVSYRVIPNLARERQKGLAETTA